MFRYIDHWQGATAKYQANLCDRLETDDFTLKGVFQFLNNSNNRIRFRGKRSFNTVQDALKNTSSLASESEYSLAIRHSPLSNLLITHLSNGPITCEGEYNLWRSDDLLHAVGIYKKCEMAQDKNCNATVQLLYNYGRNYLFNFGLKNIPLTNAAADINTVYSVGAIARFLEDKDLTSWAGVHLNFNTRNVTDVKFLLGLDNPNASGVLEFEVNRKIVPEVKTPTKVTYPKTLRVALEAKVSDTFSLFNKLTSNMEDTVQTELTVGGIYSFDALTCLKFKVQDDLNTTVAITRRYRNLLDFTFALNMMYKAAELTEEKKNLLSHVKTKFGMSLSLIDESIL